MNSNIVRHMLSVHINSNTNQATAVAWFFIMGQ